MLAGALALYMRCRLERPSASPSEDCSRLAHDRELEINERKLYDLIIMGKQYEARLTLKFGIISNLFKMQFHYITPKFVKSFR